MDHRQNKQQQSNFFRIKYAPPSGVLKLQERQIIALEEKGRTKIQATLLHRRGAFVKGNSVQEQTSI